MSEQLQRAAAAVAGSSEARKLGSSEARKLGSSEARKLYTTLNICQAVYFQ